MPSQKIASGLSSLGWSACVWQQYGVVFVVALVLLPFGFFFYEYWCSPETDKMAGVVSAVRLSA